MFFSFFISFLLLLYPTCFSAGLPPLPTTISTVNHHINLKRLHFDKLLDSKKGSKVSGITKVKNYMQRFGYLKEESANVTDEFDDRFEIAITRYQSNHGLPVTGKLDSDTIAQMKLPRCGVHDKEPPSNIHAEGKYNYFEGKPRWSRDLPATITYAFSSKDMISNLKISQIRPVFRRAFSRWSTVIPVNFTEAEDYAWSDIKIGAYFGDHGDGEPFDGVLGVLAHSFAPETGRLHLDKAETWAVDFELEKSEAAVDLESVATHEIGHVLGLAHSSDKAAIMYPTMKPREKKLDLTIDDIEGIQALYGTNPNFNFQSLSESVISSSYATNSKTNRLRWNILAMLVIAGLSF